MSIMATLNDLLVDSRTQSLLQKGRPARSIDGHEAVVAALRRRDAEGASQAMYNHIDQIADLQLHAQKGPNPPASSRRRNQWMRACERRSTQIFRILIV